MDQEQDDRRPDLFDEPPSKKQRLNRPRLTPLINPNNVDEEQQQANEQQQQQAGRKRKRRSRKASKKSRKSRRKSRKSRR